MKPNARVGLALGSKLLRPCRKLLLVFRLKKKLTIRRARGSSPRYTTTASGRASPLKRLLPVSAFVSVVRSLKKKMSARGRLGEGKATGGSKIGKVLSGSATSYSGRERLLFPSPITPAAPSAIGSAPSKSLKRRGWDSDGGVDEVEDACRSFENYLVEMMVEEGKVRDLMDVEELLLCWKNLTCPVFVDLVSRFYRELCRDLFAAADDEDDRVGY